MKLQPVVVSLGLAIGCPSTAQESKIVDLPTRPGVTQRLLVLRPEAPRAAVVLFPGGHGGVQISPTGTFGWGEGNFLVRTRQMFAKQGMVTAVIDAPSDRQAPPFLAGFRQTQEHVGDVRAVIAWLRQETGLPVWLIGTSRGTQSAAFVATRLAKAEGGPDGLVLTSTVLRDKPPARPVPEMPLGRIDVPVLVVHHRQDGCWGCPYEDLPRLMDGLTASPRKELITVQGGRSRGDPCEALAYHGYNGIEGDVVTTIVDWIKAQVAQPGSGP